jgi:hypothetical protein
MIKPLGRPSSGYTQPSLHRLNNGYTQPPLHRLNNGYTYPPSIADVTAWNDTIETPIRCIHQVA